MSATIIYIDLYLDAKQLTSLKLIIRLVDVSSIQTLLIFIIKFIADSLAVVGGH